MRRGIYLLFILCLGSVLAGAQPKRSSLFGTLTDESSAPLVQASVQLLSVRDSMMVEGVVTHSDGLFRINALPGDYIVKFSFIGMESQYRNIHIPVSAKDIPLGVIRLQTDSVYLEEAKAVARAQQVVVKEDTVIYNAAAYRVDEGAMAERLVRKIPGMQVDEKGNVTVQGKPVRRLYLNGRPFFGESVKTGLKNLPAEMIEQIKVYEIPSEMSQISGVDDGEAETVIDLGGRKDRMDGWRLMATAAGGVSNPLQEKYNGKVNLSKITKNSHITFIGGADNLGDRALSATTSRYVTGCGNRANIHERELGASLSGEKKGFKWGTNVHYDGENGDTRYDTRSETILVRGNYFSRSAGMNLTRPHSVQADASFEWKPNSKLRMVLKPKLSYRYQQTNSLSEGRSFALDSSLINHSNNASQSRTGKADAEVVFSVSRQLAKRGRSVSLYSRFRYYDNGQGYSAENTVRYYKIKVNPDSVLYRRQHYDEYAGTFYTMLQGAWNEPLTKQVHLQFQLREEFHSSSRKRDFESQPLLSSNGRYRFLATQMQVNVRLLYKKCKYTLGVTLKPQNTWLQYLEGSAWKSVNAFVFNAAPNLSVNYTPSKTHKLSFVYSSWSGQPSLYNLVPVASGTNPQYLHYGNPGLKPSFTHRATLNYNFSNPKAQNSIVASLQWRLVENAVCNSTVFDVETGARTITPANIGGNWNLSGSVVYNETFRQSPFALTTNLSWDYKNDVSLLYNNLIKRDETNTVHRLMTRLSVNGTYRNDWLEMGLGIDGSYTWEQSLLRPEMNRDPRTLTPTLSLMFFLPENIRLGTDLDVVFQRGFRYADLDRNYYVWNASASWTFLKKAATLRLEAFDILHQLPDIIANFTSTSRSLSVYSSRNSYILLSFIYRFSW